jgi:translation initiation factor IF-2
MSEEMAEVAEKESLEGQETVYINAPITVGDLAVVVGKSPIDLLRILMSFGLMVPITQAIDFETAEIVCHELNIAVRLNSAQNGEKEEEPQEVVEESTPSLIRSRRANIQGIIKSDGDASLHPRPLVVTVLGHVDHGKTTLLDTIRKTSVVDTEAGGITQGMGAYQVDHETDGRSQTITFIDTPGHQAFTQMRARGAEITDLVILVVAADDGIMPQTREAIEHAQAAEVPIVVALNKIDRPNANINNVKTQLSNQNLIPVDWEGDTHVIPVSALRGDNIDDLLDTITLLTEEMDPKANPEGPAVGTVVEAHVDRRQGVTATLLIQNGSLKQGDFIVIGGSWGRIKAMRGHEGTRLTKAGPSTPVQILGMSEPPAAGEFFEVVPTKKFAMNQSKKQLQKSVIPILTAPVTETDVNSLFEMIQGEDAKELRIILKADVQGSVDPVLTSLDGLDQEEVAIKVLRSAVGDISENDVLLAEASQAIIVGFNVAIDKSAEMRAERQNVKIRLYRIIYELIEDIERALKGMLDPEYVEIVVGQAEVRQMFPVKNGMAAGCVVIDGTVKNNASVRLVRAGAQNRSTRITEVRRFRDKVEQVRMGQDCGISLANINDFKEGDLIEVFELQEVER